MRLLNVAEGTPYEMTWVDVRNLYPWANSSGTLRPSPLAEIYLHHTAAPFGGGDQVDEVLYLVRLAAAASYRVPYNLVVFPAAPYNVWYLNDLDSNWPHTYAHNDDAAVAVAGDFQAEVPDEGLLDTLHRVVGALRNLWPQRYVPVWGHRDVYPTACPGRNLYPHLERIAAS